MDPYLESPDWWRDVHASFLAEVRLALNVSLPDGFVARTEERLYIVEPHRSIYPDLTVSRRLADSPTTSSAAVAVIDPPVVYSGAPEEIREGYIEIRSTAPGGGVVTVVELLSLANKMSGRGREEYRRKQEDLLHSDIHLLEIDLLRTGEPAVAVPYAQKSGRDYIVCLHRGDGGWRFETWTFGVRDRLPRVAVPLTSETPDVALDLGEVLRKVYVGGRYSDTIDYTQSPTPPLTPEDSAWARALLSR